MVSQDHAQPISAVTSGQSPSPCVMAENPGLAARLREAAVWLGDDIPPNTREIGGLEGDVKLDELDLYCVNLLTEAAAALGSVERDEQAASTLERVEREKAVWRETAQEQSRLRKAAEARTEALKEENADLKSSVIAFCAPWAVTYARDHDLEPGQLFAAHYDILERCGARMVDFVRVAPPATIKIQTTPLQEPPQ